MKTSINVVQLFVLTILLVWLCNKANNILYTSKMFSIENKVAIVTGGANGIGANIVREFLKENIKYVAIVDIDIASGLSLEEEVNLKYGKGRAVFFKCDVTKDQELTHVFQKAASENGSIDLVINNAGVAFGCLENYKLTIEINFTAVVTSTLKALNLMRADHGGNGGTIINISSITALAPTIGVAHIYAATKVAVNQFSNRMGMDLLYSKTNVRVMTVCFGATDTDILNKCSGFDDIINNETERIIRALKTQKVLQSAVTAAQGVVHTYKNGKSASTWLVHNNDINDITDTLKKANETIEEFIGFEI